MTLTDKVKADLTSAMRAKEKDRVGTLRLVLSELQKDAKEGKGDELAVLRRELGQAIRARAAGRRPFDGPPAQQPIDVAAEEAGPAGKPAQAPSSSGIPDAIVKLTLVASFNDLDSVARLLDEHPQGVAGMIIEPIMMNAGIIHP